jgi:hypothetical protein
MISPEKGIRRQQLLKYMHDRNYKHKFLPEFYLNFIHENSGSFSITKNHSQNTKTSNHPYLYTMFTVLTQHIQGNSVVHCIDRYYEKIGGIK